MRSFTRLLRSLLLLMIFASAFTITGCRLVFEPEADAVKRLFTSLPTGDGRVVRELCDGKDVCAKLSQMSGIIRSQWYNAQAGFFEIKQIEVAEDTGFSYVYVDLLLPERSNGPDPKIPLVFEMERIKLRWHIYQVDGIEEFLRRAERARGIL